MNLHDLFHPRGIAGRAYWWLLLPVHVVIWRRLAERLVEVAEQPAAPTLEAA